MNALKSMILLVWAFCAACFVIDTDGGLVMAGRLLFWAMAIAHVAEFAMFLGVFRQAGGSLALHFAKTLTYGLIHIREVRSQLEEPAGS